VFNGLLLYNVILWMWIEVLFPVYAMFFFLGYWRFPADSRQ